MVKQKWEYEVVSTKVATYDLNWELNTSGMEGWELVSVVPKPGSTEVFLIFKRPCE